MNRLIPILVLVLLIAVAGWLAFGGRGAMPRTGGCPSTAAPAMPKMSGG